VRTCLSMLRLLNQVSKHTCRGRCMLRAQGQEVRGLGFKHESGKADTWHTIWRDFEIGARSTAKDMVVCSTPFSSYFLLSLKRLTNILRARRAWTYLNMIRFLNLVSKHTCHGRRMFRAHRHNARELKFEIQCVVGCLFLDWTLVQVS
jgi:hypothetical protein